MLKFSLKGISFILIILYCYQILSITVVVNMHLLRIFTKNQICISTFPCSYRGISMVVK